MQQDNERDSLHAALKLASSQRARTAAAGIIAAVVLPCAGWVGAKLDSRLEVQALGEQVRAMSGQVAVLTSQQHDLVASVTALSDDSADHPGKLFILTREVRYAQRNAVKAVVLALAYESDAHKRGKRAASEQIGAAFDRRTDVDRRQPSDAADNVLATIALP